MPSTRVPRHANHASPPRALLLLLVPGDHVVVAQLAAKDVERAPHGDVHAPLARHPDPLQVVLQSPRGNTRKRSQQQSWWLHGVMAGVKESTAVGSAVPVALTSVRAPPAYVTGMGDQRPSNCTSSSSMPSCMPSTSTPCTRNSSQLCARSASVSCKRAHTPRHDWCGTRAPLGLTSQNGQHSASSSPKVGRLLWRTSLRASCEKRCQRSVTTQYCPSRLRQLRSSTRRCLPTKATCARRQHASTPTRGDNPRAPRHTTSCRWRIHLRSPAL